MLRIIEDTPISAQHYRSYCADMDSGSDVYIIFPSRDYDSVVCQRLQCRGNDIECLLNNTKSIQWQHIALPVIQRVDEPMVLLNVQTVGYSVYPNLMFSIVSGNEDGLFDVVKHEGSGDRG